MSKSPAHRALASALAGLLAAGTTPWTVSVAHAADPAKVLVMPFRVIQDQVSKSLESKTTDIIADELHNQDSVLLLTYQPPAAAATATESTSKPGSKVVVRKVAPPPPPAEDAEAPKTNSGPPPGLAQIRTGESLVKSFKFKQAAEELEAGINDYEALPGNVDVKVLREAYTQLAVAQMRAGDNEAGLRTLGDVVRLAPEAGLGSGYPPPFKRAFDQAKKKTLATPRATVNIKGEGEVELDGHDMGGAPTSSSSIIPGGHILKVKRGDGSVWAIKLMVTDGENNVTVPASGEKKDRSDSDFPTPAPSPTPVAAKSSGSAGNVLAGVTQNRIDDALISEVVEAGRAVGADYVLFGGLYKSADNIGCAPHLYSMHAHGEVALKAVAFDVDMVSAGIEANKVAVEVSSLIGNFPKGESLPAPVTKDVSGSKVAVAAVPKLSSDSKPEGGRPIVVHKSTDDDHPKVAVADVPKAEDDVKPKSDIRTLSHKSTMESGDSSNALSDNKKDNGSGSEGGSNWVLWTVLAVGGAVLLAGGATAFVVVQNNNTPVTGSASLSFK